MTRRSFFKFLGIAAAAPLALVAAEKLKPTREKLPYLPPSNPPYRVTATETRQIEWYEEVDANGYFLAPYYTPNWKECVDRKGNPLFINKDHPGPYPTYRPTNATWINKRFWELAPRMVTV